MAYKQLRALQPLLHALGPSLTPKGSWSYWSRALWSRVLVFNSLQQLPASVLVEQVLSSMYTTESSDYQLRDEIAPVLLQHLTWESCLDEAFLKSPFTASDCKKCSKGRGEHQSLSLPNHLLPHLRKHSIATHHGHLATNVRLQWYLLRYNKGPSGKLHALFGRGTQIC